MYSVVLLMAMTSGGEAVDLGRRGGCCGCYGGGRHGCHGGCYGGGCYGGYGGCYGGYGGCYGGYGGCYGGMIVVPMGKTGGGEKIGPGKEGKEKDETDAPATLVVTLPADAKLTVDGKPTTSTSAVRTFVTPELEAGKEYVYTFKAEVVRDGKTVTLEKRVDVAAGREVRVSFGDMATSVVSR